MIVVNNFEKIMISLICIVFIITNINSRNTITILLIIFQKSSKNVTIIIII